MWLVDKILVIFSFLICYLNVGSKQKSVKWFFKKPHWEYLSIKTLVMPSWRFKFIVSMSDLTEVLSTSHVLCDMYIFSNLKYLISRHLMNANYFFNHFIKTFRNQENLEPWTIEREASNGFKSDSYEWMSPISTKIKNDETWLCNVKCYQLTIYSLLNRMLMLSTLI